MIIIMIGDIVHVLNRGVEKRLIFESVADHRRFVFNLYKLNNKAGAIRSRATDFSEDLPEQDKLVEILKWSLLPNHYHLLLYESVDGGVVEFTKRLGNAYTKYFNIKNNRSGYLFQNAAKIIPAETNAHFLYLPLYIDLNPLDLAFPNWRDKGISNQKKAMNFLESYKWSSFQDYKGTNNFPLIINPRLFYETFETNEFEYQKEINLWLSGQPVSTCQVDTG